MNDLIAVLISFAYVFVVLGAAEGLRKAFKLGADFTRKVVHIGVGMWAWGTAALFQSKWFAIIPPLAFVLINYISYRRGLFMAMESTDKSNLGTVYFPLAFVALIVLLWRDSGPQNGTIDSDRLLFVASLMPMTWGDAFAAVIGRRLGKHKYTLFGTTRSWEGTLAMFVFSFVTVWAACLMISGGYLGNRIRSTPVPIIPAITAGLATLVEAVSPFGLDNLLVPAVSVIGFNLGIFVSAFFW
jgi:phytol kinase